MIDNETIRDIPRQVGTFVTDNISNKPAVDIPLMTTLAGLAGYYGIPALLKPKRVKGVREEENPEWLAPASGMSTALLGALYGAYKHGYIGKQDNASVSIHPGVM